MQMLTSASRPLLNEATGAAVGILRGFLYSSSSSCLEDEGPRRQPTSLRGSARHGPLKRKRISTGEVAPVERQSKRQHLLTDEHEPLVQRFASPSLPAQLITPSNTTVERSRKRKHMSLDEPTATDHPAKRLRRSLRAVAHTGTNMGNPEPVEDTLKLQSAVLCPDVC